MSITKNIEISSTSTESFDDAVKQGIDRAAKTIEQIRGAWVKEQKVEVDNGKISEYQVTMIITFVLADN